jgi:hypothetical protein
MPHEIPGRLKFMASDAALILDQSRTVSQRRQFAYVMVGFAGMLRAGKPSSPISSKESPSDQYKSRGIT